MTIFRGVAKRVIESLFIISKNKNSKKLFRKKVMEGNTPNGILGVPMHKLLG